MAPRREPPEPRFLRKVTKTDTCWLWTGGNTGTGYGCFHDGERNRLVHRWAYEYYVGPIPMGLQIDHLCRVRNCVNPGHLEAVTPWENVMRSTSITAVNARKTHCPSGHEYNDANTYRRKDGARNCRICVAEAMRRLRARQVVDVAEAGA